MQLEVLVSNMLKFMDYPLLIKGFDSWMSKLSAHSAHLIL